MPMSPEEKREASRAWKAANKERVAQYNAEWRKANPEASREASRKWREANKEKTRDYDRNRETPERGAARDRARRSRSLGAEHVAFSDTLMLEMYGTDCHICHLPIDLTATRRVGFPGWEQGLHRDHVIPLSRGGGTTLENCRPAHGLCNLKKSASLLK